LRKPKDEGRRDGELESFCSSINLIERYSTKFVKTPLIRNFCWQMIGGDSYSSNYSPSYCLEQIRSSKELIGYLQREVIRVKDVGRDEALFVQNRVRVN